jgi:hypothetical protein
MTTAKSNAIILPILVAIVTAGSAIATCNGSGITWSCTAGSTVAHINSAISNASDRATITFASGSYSWSSAISVNGKNGLSLVCASEGGCDVTTSGTIITLSTVSATPITNLMRISGFDFSGSNSGTGVIWIEGDVPVNQMRIDHNTFTYSAGGVGMLFGHTQAARKIRGVVDHNSFLGATDYMAVTVLGAGDNDWVPGLQGSADNLFVEDNTFSFTNDNAASGYSCIDTWHGGAVVFRHNNVHNCRVSVHGSCHGGPSNFEVYDNTISTDDAYRLIHHQGSGEFIVFNNVLSANQIALLYYRDCVDNPEGCGTCDGSQPEDGNRAPTGTYHG